MSASAYSTTSMTEFRARRSRVPGIPAGAKRFAKHCTNKVNRQHGKLELSHQVVESLTPALDLERLADELLFQSCHAAFERDEDFDLYSSDEDVDIEFEVPPELQMSLPEWLLDQVIASNGSTLDMLSLLESKTLMTSHEKLFAAMRDDEPFDD